MVIKRTQAFSVCEVGSHWKVLNSKMRSIDMCFKSISLVVVLERYSREARTEQTETLVY